MIAAPGGCASDRDSRGFPWIRLTAEEPSDIGIGGGAPGISAIIEARGEWVVIVSANFDSPGASEPGMTIANTLEK